MERLLGQNGFRLGLKRGLSRLNGLDGDARDFVKPIGLVFV